MAGIPDRDMLETRLLIVSEMLEKAVAEVHRVMADIQCEVDVSHSQPLKEARSSDG